MFPPLFSLFAFLLDFSFRLFMDFANFFIYFHFAFLLDFSFCIFMHFARFFFVEAPGLFFSVFF